MIIDKFVYIKWNSRNKKHYIELGYKFTKMSDNFEVLVKDLMPGSKVRILAKCNNCGEVRKIRFCSYRDLCSSCGHLGIKINKKKTINIISIPLYKLCKTCGVIKEKENFIKNSSKKDGLRTRCKICDKKAKEKRSDIKKEKSRKIQKEWRVKNTRHLKEYSHQYGIKHRNRLTKQKKKRYLQNPDLIYDERQNPFYIAWAYQIRKNADFKCQICGSNIKLRCHHLYSKNKYPLLRYLFSNGVCLCERHHKQFHKMYGNGRKKTNTPEQFYEFILRINKPKKKKG